MVETNVASVRNGIRNGTHHIRSWYQGLSHLASARQCCLERGDLSGGSMVVAKGSRRSNYSLRRKTHTRIPDVARTITPGDSHPKSSL